MSAIPRVIQSSTFPKPLGPYSHAIVHGGLLRTSGQIAIDSAGTNLCDADIGVQVGCIFDNLQKILKEAGATVEHILDVVVFLTDIHDFPAFNEHYGKCLGSHRPTRSVVEVSALPKGAKVELKVLAYIEKSA